MDKWPSCVLGTSFLSVAKDAVFCNSYLQEKCTVMCTQENLEKKTWNICSIKGIDYWLHVANLYKGSVI